MLDPLLDILPASGLALGAIAAQITGPLSWNWRPRMGSIHHRLRCLPRQAPRAASRAAGLALLAVLLAGGALAAYAAEPSAPQRLARDVAGVTGSGDQLSLYLKEGDKLRRLRPGEAYEEGWTLKALTPSEATLEKDGESRRVGLNPTGALAAGPAGPASPVQVLGWSDEALIARAIDKGQWDGVKLQPGLNLEQTRRFWVLEEKFEVRLQAFSEDIYARAERAGLPKPEIGFVATTVLAALGPVDGREYLEVTNQGHLAFAERAQGLYDQYGPVQLHSPSNTAQVALKTPYGGNDGVWTISNRQPDGGFDITLSPPNPNLVSPLSAADNPGPFKPLVFYASDGRLPDVPGPTMPPDPPPP